MERYCGYADADEDEDEPPSMAFHHAFEDVIDQYHALKAFNSLPDAGGWQDQDADWTDDLLLLDALEAWVRKQHEDDEPLPKGKRRNPLDALVNGDDDEDVATDIRSWFG